MTKNTNEKQTTGDLLVLAGLFVRATLRCSKRKRITQIKEGKVKERENNKEGKGINRRGKKGMDRGKSKAKYIIKIKLYGWMIIES